MVSATVKYFEFAVKRVPSVNPPGVNVHPSLSSVSRHSDEALDEPSNRRQFVHLQRTGRFGAGCRRWHMTKTDDNFVSLAPSLPGDQMAQAETIIPWLEYGLLSRPYFRTPPQRRAPRRYCGLADSSNCQVTGSRRNPSASTRREESSAAYVLTGRSSRSASMATTSSRACAAAA